jgi:hypothetical protein
VGHIKRELFLRLEQKLHLLSKPGKHFVTPTLPPMRHPPSVHLPAEYESIISQHVAN